MGKGLLHEVCHKFFIADRAGSGYLNTGRAKRETNFWFGTASSFLSNFLRQLTFLTGINNEDRRTVNNIQHMSIIIDMFSDSAAGLRSPVLY
jgi:hypothetical protein